MYILVPLTLIAVISIALAWFLETVGGVSIDLNAILGAAALVLGSIVIAVVALFGGSPETDEQADSTTRA